VSTGAGCSWSVTSSATWLAVSPRSGVGSGTLSLSVPVNPGGARSTSVTIGSLQLPVQQAGDTTPPVGSIGFAGGLTVTRNTAVTLALSASDAAGVAAACVSNTASCNAWAAYAATRSWTLAATPGSQVVRAWFRDPAGNVSAPASASIVYDPTPPVGGNLAATAARTSVALSWGGFSDPLSGVASYTLVYARGSPPASCGAGTRLYAGSATSGAAPGLAAGTTYGFRVCATDKAGNVSAGVAKSVSTLR